MSPRIYQDNEVESTMKAGELFRRFITDQKVIINLEQINEVTLERFKNLMEVFFNDSMVRMRKDRDTGLVEDLKPDEIFVFGSNLSGRHGKGAAKMAMRWGAKYGKGSGPQNRTYAIPTKTANIKKTLGLNEIRKYVDEFIDYAEKHPEQTFLVTEIGCGLAGLRPDDVGPMFLPAVRHKNIKLPKRFWKAIEKDCRKRFDKILKK